MTVSITHEDPPLPPPPPPRKNPHIFRFESVPHHRQCTALLDWYGNSPRSLPFTGFSQWLQSATPSPNGQIIQEVLHFSACCWKKQGIGQKLFKFSKTLTLYGWIRICVTSKCLNLMKNFWVMSASWHWSRFSKPKKGHKYPSNGPENSHRSHRGAHNSDFQKIIRKESFQKFNIWGIPLKTDNKIVEVNSVFTITWHQFLVQIKATGR